jgi:2-keto-4-pentenoate hydratase/2-oxohepta-3-ene-1,7-dioic acid hydratase in catechol pathway
MKLLSFEITGINRFGAVIGDRIVDLSARTKYSSLRAALAAGALAELKAAMQGQIGDFKLSDVTMLTPVPDAEKIVCIGVNYMAHILEVGRKPPEQPSVFFRLHHSLVADGMPIVRPIVSQDFDYEGELAVVIGKAGRSITREAALDHVAGYTCFNDGSIRDFQMKGSLAIGKNFAATGSMGPWMVTADEIPDPKMLQLETRLNGKRVQHSGVDDLIFDVPAIINYVSAAFELVPGDIIATGTPHGVALGMKPPVWMKPGDDLEIEISKIGVLRNRVVDAAG